MTTSRIRAPRRWALPVALCVLVTVGCSSVDGSTAGSGSSPVAPSLPSTASSVPDRPGTTSSDPSVGEPATTAPDTEPDTTPQDTTAQDTTGSDVTVTTPDASSSSMSSPNPRTTPARTVSIDRFQSPTRNIGCLIDQGTYVRCDLGTSAITEKHDCQGVGDWGQAVALTAGKPAAMLCASDTVKDASAPVLPYGSSTKVGSITCTSREDGMHCGDGAGHGFWLSRSSYAVS